MKRRNFTLLYLDPLEHIKLAKDLGDWHEGISQNSLGRCFQEIRFTKWYFEYKKQKAANLFWQNNQICNFWPKCFILATR